MLVSNSTGAVSVQLDGAESKVNLVLSQEQSTEKIVANLISPSPFWQRVTEVLDTTSGSAVGEAFGATKQAAYLWRDGETLPKVLALVAFAKSRNVSLHWLLTGEGPKEIGGESTQTNNLSDEIRAALERYAHKNGYTLEVATNVLLTEALKSKGELPQRGFVIICDTAALPLVPLPLVAIVNSSGITELPEPWEIVTMTMITSAAEAEFAVQLKGDVDSFRDGTRFACRKLHEHEPMPGQMLILQIEGKPAIRHFEYGNAQRITLTTPDRVRSTHPAETINFRYVIVSIEPPR